MTFSELKLLICSDFERLLVKKTNSLFVVFLNCLKHGVLATISYSRLSHYIISLRRPHPFLKRILRFLLRPRLDIHIHEKAEIGPGLCIYHGSGVVIGNGVVAGKNLTLHQGVTLGNRIGSKKTDWDSFPKLGDNVFIGCGASILGNITIGNNVKIGAHALVLNDVPDSCIAMGIPAKIITSFNNLSSND